MAILDALDLCSFTKTSGSKGLQIFVPLNADVTYQRTKAFARCMAGGLEKIFPDLVLSRMGKHLRSGKVFVDWSQNDAKKTTVTAYSLRAKDHPTVSTPVSWAEVTKAAKTGEILRFESTATLRRIKARGDLFAPVLSMRQELPPLRKLNSLLGMRLSRESAFFSKHRL